MFRTFQTQLDQSGSGSIHISPYIESVEWDIYQISVQTSTLVTACQCHLHHNGYFLCHSIQGSRDTAVGPPDVVVKPADMFAIYWLNGAPNDQATVGIWYNENPQGTTSSTAH